MSVINTNISSMQAQASVRTSGLNLSTAMERLSSGVRINSAKDDAAGLAISTRMTASIRGISAAIRNANDGISLTQTAEGSLGQIGDNLQRIRELAVQSANTGNNASDRAAMNNEATQLIAEIDRVAANTTYNGINLLDGTFQAQNLQVGAGSGTNDRIAISISSASSAALGVGLNSNYTVGGSTSVAGALVAGGLSLNAVAVGASASDGVSFADDDASGIAIAAAINAVSGTSGVTATVGETTIAGTAPNAAGYATDILAGDVEINGVSIGAIAAASSAVARGGQVAAAVNAISTQTGVTATFSTSTGAVALNATDGRNISISATNAGGGALVTGLGAGSMAFQAVGTAAPTTTTAIAADTLSVNGVSIGAVAAGATATEVATITFSDMAVGQSFILNGVTISAKSSGTTSAADIATAYIAATHATTPTAVTATASAVGYTGTPTTGYGQAAAVTANTAQVTLTSSTANAYVADLAETTDASNVVSVAVTTQGNSAVTSKAANLVTALNLLTTSTGVSASSSSTGVVTLVSTVGSAMTLSGFTAAETGLAAPTISSTGSAVDTTITRSSAVTLSSSGSDGITIGDLDALSASASGLTVGYNAASTSIGTGVSGIDLTTASSSQDALTTLDLAIDTITDSRAAMGAYQNRLTASISNLETTSMNLSASRSRILDTDYAKETTNLAKSQIIQQAATAMLAQANQSGQSVLALLK